MRGWRIGTLGGIAIEVNWTWLLLFAIFAWNLSDEALAWQHGLPPWAYQLAGAAMSLLVVLSVLGHELCHSLVARARGIPVRRITLFLFGGVAQIEEEARSPRDELLMTGAGPGASFLLAGLFLGLSWVAREHLEAPALLAGSLGAVGRINLMLAIFNLLPGLPLDGGRLLHSLVWHHTGDRYQATRVAASSGMLLGAGMMILSGLGFLAGGGGLLWVFFLGWMIMWLARTQLRMSQLEEGLRRLQVGQVMQWPVVNLPADLRLSEAVAAHGGVIAQPVFPVVGPRGEALGVLEPAHLQGIPPADWSRYTVGQAMEPLDSPAMTADLHDPALEALRRLSQSPRSWLLVRTAQGQPVGLVTEHSLLAASAAPSHPATA